LGWSCASSNPGRGTNQKGTGATSSFATRTRDQWGVLSSHNPLDPPNPLGGSGDLIIRWAEVRVLPAPPAKTDKPAGVLIRAGTPVSNESVREPAGGGPETARRGKRH
jgi:hypothetical protein